ncbi:MAG TPA: hypothetical protein DCE71_00610 [Parachlamydiales bacterium]|nr:hypothetical protein [Parachlamydiales bacterium]
MKKLVRVKNVEYIDGYKIKVAFTNGKIKIVDLAYIFKGNAGHYFESLRDLERFKEVYCDYGTICWPNEADFCPDLLYMIGQDVKPTTSRRKKSSKVPRTRKTVRAKMSKSSRAKE